MNYNVLYGDNFNMDEYNERLNSINQAFLSNENTKPDYYFSSPGRAEVLGNHTDHNHGLVMVASISCDILAAVKKTDNNIVKIVSLGYEPVIVDISDVTIHKEEYGTSNALVRGVAKKLNERGLKVNGFTAYTTSTIFKGAGVSSSAAFEVLVCEIFNTLYLNGTLTPVDRAVISQFAENVYFGKPCGILDQSGISFGSLTKIDFNCPEKPIVTKMNPPKGYSLVLTNTGGNHANLTEHYAAIREEMTAIANYFGKKVLRDVPYQEFISQVANLKSHFSGRSILRAMHYFNENNRVIAAETALSNNDTKGFLNAVNGSGLSSLVLLQNCSVPGDTLQPVILGIEYSRQIIKDGAVRVHGGGFAGSILAFVSNEEVDSYIASMKNVFGENNVFKASIRTIGTTIID